MCETSQSIHNLSGLREYVYDQLCEHEKLVPGCFQMTERVLTRRGQPCGMYFCLHGPRSVKFTAIWETDRNTILFYGSSGERFQKATLMAAPELAPQVASAAAA